MNNFISMRLVKQLYELSDRKGVLAILNERKKRVLLIRSSDSLVSLARVMKGIKSRNRRFRELRKDYRSFEIKLLDMDNSRLRFQYWVDHYTALGYSFYESYTSIRYKVVVEVEPE